MSDEITISLPKGLNAKIEKEIKKGKFASKSEFLLSVLRVWDKANPVIPPAIPKKTRKAREVELTPDEKNAIDEANDDIEHGRFVPHEEIMKFLNR